MGCKWMRMISLLLVTVLLYSLFGCAVEQDNGESTESSNNDTSNNGENEKEDDPEDSSGDTGGSEDSGQEDTGDSSDSGEHTHIYNSTVHKATCIAGGYVEYTCECGDSYTGNETEPGDHSYTSQKVAATNTTPGYTLYTCSLCSLNYKADYVWNVTDDVTAFFNDAAFIGDSVTLALRNYNLSSGALGNATFLCQGSYSVGHAVNNTMYLSYQGQNMSPQDALAACGAKKVFILLGMNDIALYGIDATLANWKTMIDSIRQKNPDIQIFIQSGTPIYTDGEIGSLNNENMDKYNERLKSFAAEEGLFYVDVATPMKDSSNGLAEKYCSDEYVHLTDTACALWVSILKSFISA